MDSTVNKLSNALLSANLAERIEELIPGLVYVYDLVERRNVYANHSLAAFLGCSALDVARLGDQVLPTVIHPDDLGRALAHHERLRGVADGEVAEIEYRLRDASGAWRWVHSWEVVLMRDAQGLAQQVLGLAQDVTPRVRVEEELRESQRKHAESEQRWRSIAENPFDFVIVIDRHYKYTFVNFVAPGLRVEDLIGKQGPHDYVSPPYQAAMMEAFEYAFREGRPTSYEVFVEPLQKWYHNLVGPIREGHTVTHLSVLTRDITAEKRAQAQARQAEQQLRRMEAKLAQSAKLEAVGQLAGGIAHDFNNLLTGIGGVVEMLAMRFEHDDCLSDLIEVRQAVQRGAALTRQLLAFSRQQAIAPTALSLNGLIDGTSRMLRRLIGADVEFVLELPEREVCVRADPSQLEQVLINLSVNARDAMPAGGRLTLELAVITIDEHVRAEHPEAHLDLYARLSVSDTGTGMDELTLGRIFEPFFTTKPLGVGTGLGLSMVHGTVMKAGGFIEVKSQLGRGSSFEVWLPVAIGERPEPAAPREARRGGTETILLVEDEEMVLRFTSRLLQKFGYRVLTAARGEDALALVHDGAQFDLLITDVLLPGIDGQELFRRIAARRGGMPVVFMSGYTDNVLAEGGLAEAKALFLPKPFTPDDLATKVRAALDARAPVAPPKV